MPFLPLDNSSSANNQHRSAPISVPLCAPASPREIFCVLCVLSRQKIMSHQLLTSYLSTPYTFPFLLPRFPFSPPISVNQRRLAFPLSASERNSLVSMCSFMANSLQYLSIHYGLS